MQKNGFTLIELLAVIIVLGIIMVIAAPNIFNSQNAMKSTLTDKEKKNVVDASNWVGVDLDDIDSDIFGCKGWVRGKCDNETKWTKVTGITIKELKDNGYLIDVESHMNENCSVTINKQTDGTYKVTFGSNC